MRRVTARAGGGYFFFSILLEWSRIYTTDDRKVYKKLCGRLLAGKTSKNSTSSTKCTYVLKTPARRIVKESPKRTQHEQERERARSVWNLQ
jgi:hypothetical protein